MAIKIKKERPKAEPEVDEDGEGSLIDEEFKDDQVLRAGEETFSFIERNRPIVFGGVFLLAVGAWWLSTNPQRVAKNMAENSAGLFSVLHVAQSPVGEGAEYDSATERGESLVSAATAAAAESIILGHQPYFQLMLGRGNLDSGDAASAVNAYQSAASSLEGPEAIVAQFGVATAQAADGDLSTAITVLDSIATEQPSFSFAADVHRARLIDAYGDDADAMDAYERVLDAHGERTDLATIQYRLDQLEVLAAASSDATDEPAEETTDEDSAE